MSKTRNVYVKCQYCDDIRFLKRFNTDSLRTCRSCAAKITNKKTNFAYKGGKIGGRKNVESGKLREISEKYANTPEAHKKRFETLKRKGKLFSSKPEEELKKILENKYGIENVIHHVQVNGFRIDLHVTSIDIYFQLDGEYWHGLNVEYENLKGTPKIKFDRDRLCDKYFLENNLKLIRITDKELKNNPGCVDEKISKNICSSCE